MLLPSCHQTDQAGFSICSPRVAGKTTAVVEIILQEVKRGNKVRLSSFAEFLISGHLQTADLVWRLAAGHHTALYCTDTACTV